MSHLSIKTRLVALVAGLLVLFVLAAALGVIRMHAGNEALGDLYSDRVASLEELKDVADAYGLGIVDTAHKVASGAQKPADGLAVVRASQARAAAQWKAYTGSYLDDDERPLVARAQPLVAAADAVAAQLAARLAAGDVDGVRALADKQIYPAVDPVDDIFEKLARLQLDGARSEVDAAQALYGRVLWIAVAVGLLVLGIAGVLAWGLVRAIAQGLDQAVGVARTVAAGDLGARIEVVRRDEFGTLLSALKTMNDGLATIVGEVRNASDSIATGSGQIAIGNADLSQRTEEQASNLQQTAASMEQLTVTVRRNAETAQRASALAGAASAAAAEGGAVVERVVRTMDGINDSARRIADITGTIDGIAFQTNILALNAAVEAARAGEQGRGFAVVASEVRSLAQRSATAAREIKALIGESVVKVEDGTRLVAEAGRAIGGIVEQVRRVDVLIGEISSASSEQATGLGQVGEAVTQLDQVTQQNAALVEESAAAADSLRTQADGLARAVASFRL
jgi:methyl-accepting chemotaxis protein